MKAESMTLPNKPYEINIIGDEAIITLFDNVQHIPEVEDKPEHWEWDEYKLTAKYRANLADSIENSFDIWLNAAKARAYDDMAKAVRKRRNDLLAETDYLMYSDYPITDTAKERISQYRQKLRDISKQRGFPFKVVFPEKPEV